MREDGHDFAFLKATGGNTYVDPTLTRNAADAATAGLLRGAYHFYIPKDDPKSQARHYLETTKGLTLDLPPVLDVEKIPPHDDVATFRSQIRIWLDVVEDARGCKPIIYASRSFWADYLGPEFAAYPLWLAEYAKRARPPKGSGGWVFWQSSQEGRIDGIKGPVDLNHFNGNGAQLEEMKC